ncbi:TIGR04551 family protein [Polyangium sp. 15x6]|uniref:TIGR04551 family protein n=1 Tax=Polyangium sp. 15x6 TaxID=3042687 RepID=UPI00249B67C8|nr:TIGR04551 family protein [Polyangium sp. 15x6]MDI3289231.1 TIGR04551 family protein [Polyangium sp. 15x6]
MPPNGTGAATPTQATPEAASQTATPPAPKPAAPVAATPDPDRDARALTRQGADRPPPTGDVGVRPSDVFAEDWWSQARPSLEIHGLFRVRAELFHHFSLGRRELPDRALWPQPPDNAYYPTSGAIQTVTLCGDVPTATTACENNTQAGANMRFRLTPELHISDNLRVLSQIDILDNFVLGSTPEGYWNTPADAGGYRVGTRGGYAPLGALATTSWAPVAGQTSTVDSIIVKRAWGEYVTPVGLLRFGRMPNQWGLGILNNEGNGYDSDYQSTVDRIMFVTGIKKYDLYFAGAWDFISEGPTSAALREQQGQPYDLGQLDDVSQYVFMAARKRDPELARLDLAKGLPVINGGIYFAYRNQVLANDTTDAQTSATFGQSASDIRTGYARRGAQFFTPDLWFQFLYKKFRFEAEASMTYGTIDNLQTAGGTTVERNPLDAEDTGWTVRSFIVAAQSEFRALDDKLRLDLGFGWASGDPDVEGLAPPRGGVERQLTADRTFSTGRFHPDYRVDLILWRNIMSRVQGAYYLRPSVQYDFARDPNGQRLGGSAALIWSRASEFIQTPGNKRDLGVELDFSLYFQAKDGTLNDKPDQMGGFYTMLQYGVLFPLGGFDYLPGEIGRYESAPENRSAPTLETETAQTLRWYLGIMF